MRSIFSRWGKAQQRTPRPLASLATGREVRIGLDLGTANTRCIVNLLGATPNEDETLALALDGDRVCMPSTIAVSNDIMHIGSTAESMDGALRSVLMWLPMLSGDTIDTSCSGKYDNLRQSVFNFGDHMISAKEVIVLYLERVLGRLLQGLNQHIGQGAWHGTLRVSVPAAASDAYRDLLQEIVMLALDMARGANGREPTMTDSLSGLTERYQRGSGRAPLDHLQVNIVSDAEAAAVAITAGASPKSSSRIVAIDLGAGSTTATCFTHDGFRATLRGVHGDWHGMDDIDSLFAKGRAVRRKPPRVFRESTGLRASDRSLIRHGLNLLCAPMREVLGMATHGGQSIERWCKGRRAAFDLVLLGGGAQCQIVRDEFKRRSNSPLPGAVEFWDVRLAVPTRTTSLLCVDSRGPGAQQPIDPSQLPLLVIAEGLAERSVTILDRRQRQPSLQGRLQQLQRNVHRPLFDRHHSVLAKPVTTCTDHIAIVSALPTGHRAQTSLPLACRPTITNSLHANILAIGAKAKR